MQLGMGMVQSAWQGAGLVGKTLHYPLDNLVDPMVTGKGREDIHIHHDMSDDLYAWVEGLEAGPVLSGHMA